jgi:hypothetical protein
MRGLFVMPTWEGAQNAYLDELRAVVRS